MMANLRVAVIFALLFLLIFIPFVNVQASSSDSQENVAENVSDDKDLMEAIKAGLTRTPEGMTTLGEKLRHIDLTTIEGKDYIFAEVKDPKKEPTIIKGKEYIGEETGNGVAPPPKTVIAQGKNYSSVFIAAGKGFRTEPTDEIIFGKKYPFYGDVGRDTRITTASDVMGQIYTGKAYPFYDDTERDTRRTTAAEAMGQLYVGKEYPPIVEEKASVTTPAYTFMESPTTSPIGEYIEDVGGILSNTLSFMKSNTHIVFIFSMFITTMIIAIKTKRR